MEDFTLRFRLLSLKLKFMEIFFASKIISEFTFSISLSDEFKKNEVIKRIDPVIKNKATKYKKMLLVIKLFLLKEFHAF